MCVLMRGSVEVACASIGLACGTKPCGARGHAGPWCGCGESEQRPRDEPSRGREAEASFLARRPEELLAGVLNHGPPQGRCSAASLAHEDSAFVAPPRGEAQAAELVGDELAPPRGRGKWFCQGRIHRTSDAHRQWRWRLQTREPSERLDEDHAINPPSWCAICRCFFIPVR
jgi:hypothetical protein